MRRDVLLVASAVLAACVATPGVGGPISCQPIGYTPAPVAFTFPSGPVSASTAEQTAAGLFGACELAGATITAPTTRSEQAEGDRGGPNAGQTVWRVHVDATVTEPSAGAKYESHFIIEVDQATGRPTVVAYG